MTRRHPAVPLAEPIMRALKGDDDTGEREQADCLDLGDYGEVKGEAGFFKIIKTFVTVGHK